MPARRFTRGSNHLTSMNSSSTLPSGSSTDPEAVLQMLRRELVLAIESRDGEVFKSKLQCIMENSADFVDLVLLSGLDPDGKTALHLAVENRFLEAVEFLVSTGKVDLVATAGDGGWSALHTAVDLGDVELTRALLPTHNSDIAPKRLLAALKQHTASPSSVTALHMAVCRNSSACAVVLFQTANDLVRAQSAEWTTSEEEEDVVKSQEELQQRRDFHGQAEEGSRRLNKLKDANGDTPLHWAVKSNNYAMARLLCSFGARPRHCHNCQGQTPLALSKYVLRNTKMTKLLGSFSPTSSKFPPEDVNNIENTPEDRIQPLQFPTPPPPPPPNVVSHLRGFAAKPIAVDGNSRRIQRTSVSVEMAVAGATAVPGPAESVVAGGEPNKKRAPMSVDANEQTGCGNISGRPYLHRESKAAFAQALTDPRYESDNLNQSRSVSLKCGKQEAEHIRQKLCWHPNLRRSVVHKPRLIPRKARRKASMMDPAEYYPMASPRRGICVVINNMTYWHPKFQNRGGCDKDERRVEKVFVDLGFLVKVLRNLSSGEMQSELAFIGRKTDHSAYDAFVAVVMTHGGLGELYGVNGDAFPVHKLTLDFTAEKCPSLAGKPKLFFIQACRGEEYQLGYAIPSSSEDLSVNPLQIRTSGNEISETTAVEDNAFLLDEEKPSIIAAKLPKRPRLVPSFADFLLSYATLAGFKAQRDPQKGSIYIQTLCHYLEMYGKSRSLLDIVTSVHREVSEKVFREAEDPSQEGTLFQQTPEVRHTLTRIVQFV